MAANTYTETEPLLAPGLAPTETVYHNLQPAALYEIAIRAEEGQVARGGAFCAITTPHTGRSPKDKFIVRDAGSADDIWWGKVNQPISPGRPTTFGGAKSTNPSHRITGMCCGPT